VFRDRIVGRIWCYDAGSMSGPMAEYLCHWYWRDLEGRKDTEGHAPTLAAAMSDF